jgi:Recombinase
LLVKHIAFYWLSRNLNSAKNISLKAQRELARGYARTGKLIEEVQASDRAPARDLETAVISARRYDAVLAIPNMRPLFRRPDLLISLTKPDVQVVSFDGKNPERVDLDELVSALRRWLDASRNIRRGLQLAKARGVQLGNPGIKIVQSAGTLAASRNSKKLMQNSSLLHQISTLRKDGLSLRKIASSLNGKKISTARGGLWHASTIRNVLQSVMD